jgi:hypothetical protein
MPEGSTESARPDAHADRTLRAMDARTLIVERDACAPRTAGARGPVRRRFRHDERDGRRALRRQDGADRRRLPAGRRLRYLRAAARPPSPSAHSGQAGRRRGEHGRRREFDRRQLLVQGRPSRRAHHRRVPRQSGPGTGPGRAGVEFDARRFAWLGAPLREVTVCTIARRRGISGVGRGKHRRLPSDSGARVWAARRTMPPGSSRRPWGCRFISCADIGVRSRSGLRSSPARWTGSAACGTP